MSTKIARQQARAHKFETQKQKPKNASPLEDALFGNGCDVNARLRRLDTFTDCFDLSCVVTWSFPDVWNVDAAQCDLFRENESLRTQLMQCSLEQSDSQTEMRQLRCQLDLAKTGLAKEAKAHSVTCALLTKMSATKTETQVSHSTTSTSTSLSTAPPKESSESKVVRLEWKCHCRCVGGGR